MTSGTPTPEPSKGLEHLQAPAVQKVEYERTMEDRLAELGARMDHLLEKLEAQKIEMQLKAEEFKVKSAEAKVKLNQLKSSTGQAWAEMKIGMEEALNDVKKAFEHLHDASDRARTKFH